MTTSGLKAQTQRQLSVSTLNSPFTEVPTVLLEVLNNVVQFFHLSFAVNLKVFKNLSLGYAMSSNLSR